MTKLNINFLNYLIKRLAVRISLRLLIEAKQG